MGHITDEAGRLCCDSCGQAGGVRRRRCPVGYCPSDALCATCYATFRSSGGWASAHAECPRRSAEYHAELAARAAAPEQWARTAWGDWAANVPTGMVKVVTYANTVVFIPKGEYEPSKPLPAQYVAAAVAYDGITTKQVVL